MFQPVVLIAIAAACVVWVTGWWRLAFAAFGIRPRQMTVDRLGLLVDTPEQVERVNVILNSFAGGFNRMIGSPSATAWRRYVARLPALLQPFAHEGAAMGYRLRYLGRFDATEFEDRLVRREPGLRYLYYVGLGFWCGMRHYSPEAVERISEGLDPLHRYLVFDGYGFKRAFFDHPRDAAAFDRLDGLSGYARSAAFQGVGRALWFRFMGRPDRLFEEMERLGTFAADAAAGVGLAAAFTNPDRLETAIALARLVPAAWQPHVHLGLCFGLKARSISDRDQFERDMGRWPEAVRDAVLASIRECDRVELQVRADGEADGYRRWRERVTNWMSLNVTFPMAGLTSLSLLPQEQEKTLTPEN